MRVVGDMRKIAMFFITRLEGQILTQMSENRAWNALGFQSACSACQLPVPSVGVQLTNTLNSPGEGSMCERFRLALKLYRKRKIIVTHKMNKCAIVKSENVK